MLPRTAKGLLRLDYISYLYMLEKTGKSTSFGFVFKKETLQHVDYVGKMAESWIHLCAFCKKYAKKLSSRIYASPVRSSTVIHEYFLSLCG